uniref:Major facilitator superfamily associated domain-containing protein n=1 Tax=Panagrolaimus superbus TaxID=310955 RepID=A0A914YRZ9_9BILA
MMTMDSVGAGTADGRSIHFMGRDIPRDLFMVRLFYLLWFASFGSLFPLLAVYFKQLGMTAAQAGVLLGCRPLIEFLATPFWGMFAQKFRRGKVLLMFSLSALIISTLAVGFVQPVTPYCVVLDKNDTGGECKLIIPAEEVVRGGALGYLKEATGLGRRKRDTANKIIDTIIDLSTYNGEEDMVAGMAPEYITKENVCNYEEEVYGTLVSPPHSTRVYREPAVQQAFMLLLILIALGEFFSSPALPLVDGCTLNLVSDQPQEFGRIRLFGSIGWGMAMFVMGIGLDYSDTFRNHPCPTKNTTEKNYILCFVTSTILTAMSMAVATQFRFGQEHEQHRPDEVGGLVMDTQLTEVDPAIAEKTRGKQLRTNEARGEQNEWRAALKAMMNVHFMLYLLGVVTIGFGAGNVFAFLYWYLQDLGGSPILFGMASVVNHAAEIAAFFYTFRFINKYGYVKTMYACLGANVVRFLLISWLSNPWMILPLQAVQGTVLAVNWATATSYVSLVSPPHLKNTSQQILLILYHGVGRGLGAMVGGTIITTIGARLFFALLAFITACVLAANYAGNRMLKYDGIKYSHNFDEEDITFAPQGMPMGNPESKITEAFNQTSVVNSNYGTIGPDPQDDAYDRYVSNPYE